MAKYLTILLIFCSLLANAQVKRALSFINDSEYERAQSALEKGLGKDSSDPGLLYCYSLLLIQPDYLNYNLGESYLKIRSSIDSYKLLDMESKIELAEDGVDSAAIYSLKEKLDLMGLEKAREGNRIPKPGCIFFVF